MTPHEFAHQLEKTYAGNLESVVLYGSAASDGFSKKLSDYNLIVVLKNPSPANLSKATSLVHKWIKKGNPSPLFFDPQHIDNSLDVFPLEFLDIADRHNVLVGNDPFKDINIDRSNLRHQCESELKGKLLNLRSFYSANCDKPKLIAQAILRTFPSFLAVFRGVIHMLGETPERDPTKLIESLVKHIDFNSQIFMDLIAIRAGNAMLPRKAEALEAFERYVTAIEAVTGFVDKLETR